MTTLTKKELATLLREAISWKTALKNLIDNPEMTALDLIRALDSDEFRENEKSYVLSTMDYFENTTVPDRALKDDTASALYLMSQSEQNYSAGDAVKITRSAEAYEGGWTNYWTPGQHLSVGSVSEVVEIQGARGIKLSNGFVYPFFVLSKEI